ncbi:MAG: hypothetical protein CFE36_13525 [Sphingomonadaceae bacterium PASS1]|nr:MAG: hypothetical protein CFE36_13525 [Sphingomonadaceae bacterium PASS1]
MTETIEMRSDIIARIATLASSRVANAFWPDGLGSPSFMATMSQLYPVFGRSLNSGSTTGQGDGTLFNSGKQIDIGVGHYLSAPPEAITAAIQSLQAGHTRYTHVPNLYRAIIAKYLVEQHVDVHEQQIVTTAGARTAMGLVFSALLEPGQTVVIGDPDYIGLTHMAASIGCRIVRPASKRASTGELRPDIDRIVTEIEAGARMFAFTNPCNPTGYIWSRAEIAAIVAAAQKSGTWIMANEIYDKLYFDDTDHISLVQFEDTDRTIVVSGTAKNYDMTGFGLGWIVGSGKLVALLSDWQFITHSGAPDALSQYAAAAALCDPVRDRHPAASRKLLKENWILLRDALQQAGLETCGAPKAGQFAFPYIGGDDIALSLQMMREFDVLVTPGGIWGGMGAGHIRVALSNPAETHCEGVARLMTGLGIKVSQN